MVNEWNGRGFRMSLERVPWLPLYRGSPDRRVVSLRKVLANLAKLCHLVEHVRAWLSSWSSGHITARCDMALLCWPWWHYILDGGSSVVLCIIVSAVAFVIAS